MRGHIYKRSKASWTIKYDIGMDPITGKRRQKGRAIKGTRKDAERELAKALHGLDSGSYIEPSEVSVREYLRRWLRDYALPNLAPRTYDRYEIIVRCHLVPHLGSLRLRDIHPQHIIAVMGVWRESGRVDGKGGLSGQSCLHNYRVLKEALGHAVKWRLASVNPADAVDPPKAVRREVNAFDTEGVGRLLAVTDGQELGNIVHVALFTGLRRGELLGLRWSDVDLDDAKVHVQQTVYRRPGHGFVFGQPKTSRSRRTVALSKSTVGALRRQRAKLAERRLLLGPAYRDHDLVFPASVGGPMDQTSFNRRWKTLLDHAGLKTAPFHTCRHTFASLMLRAGVHPKVVQEALGHSSIAVTLDLYSHLIPEMQQEAIERLDVQLGLSG